jgi:GT2 family glycosyltransferase
LHSLATQATEAPFEIVVVDNGSVDTTREVVSEWTRGDERFRLLTEPRVGLSYAKNAGLRHARGQLTLFTDDDVVVPEGWIAAYARFFASCELLRGLAGGPIMPIAHDLSSWPRWVSRSATADLPRLYHGAAERQLKDFDWLWGANMAARTAYLSEVGGFDETLGYSGEDRRTFEDIELAQRVRTAGDQVWYCPSAVVYHRVPEVASRPRSLTRAAFSRGANDFLRAQRGSYFEPTVRVPTRSLTSGLVLPWLLTSWVVCAIGFRLAGRPPMFELARRSAWGAGWCMVAATEGRSDRLKNRLRRIVSLAQRLALRLTSA